VEDYRKYRHSTTVYRGIFCGTFRGAKSMIPPNTNMDVIVKQLFMVLHITQRIIRVKCIPRSMPAPNTRGFLAEQFNSREFKSSSRTRVLMRGICCQNR